MKAIRMHGRGGPERLVYEEVPRPHPGQGEVLVRVYATGVIANELRWDETYQTKAGSKRVLPIPGRDLSGVVEEVGPATPTLTKGSQVYAMMDLVFDTVGGDTLQHSWQVIKPAGVLVTMVSPPPSFEHAKAHGIRPFWFVVEPNRDELIQIGTLIDARHLRPIIETVFPLAQARQAYEQGVRGHTRGKIVLRVVDETKEGHSSVGHRRIACVPYGRAREVRENQNSGYYHTISAR